MKKKRGKAAEAQRGSPCREPGCTRKSTALLSVSMGFCAECWEVAQFRPQFGTPCGGCGVPSHPSLLKNGRCFSCGLAPNLSAAPAPAPTTKSTPTKNAAAVRSLADTSRDGRVWVWGSNAYGQLGGGGAFGVEVPLPSPLDVPAVRAVACGLFHSVLLMEVGGWLMVAGRNCEGQLGTADPASRSQFVPADPGDLDQSNEVAVRVVAGNYHTAVQTASRGGSGSSRVLETGRGVCKFAPVLVNEPVELMTAAGNATCVFAPPRVLVWGWGGGKGVVNEALSGVSVETLAGSKFEILVGLAGGEFVTLRNDEVAEAHRFEAAPVPELSVLRGAAEIAVGNSWSAAISLSGQAVSWRRDTSSGAMRSAPVACACPGAPLVVGSTGSDVIVLGTQGARWSVAGHEVTGRFCAVAAGQFHALLLSGTYQGSAGFPADTQRLLFSGAFADDALGGVPCHQLFLRASGVAIPNMRLHLKTAPEHLVRAFLLYLYTERPVLDREASDELLGLVERIGGPVRLLQLLRREASEPCSLTRRLLSDDGHDAELVCDGGRLLPTHLCLLAARSSYFLAAASERWGRHNRLCVSYAVEAMRVFVRFCHGVVAPAGLELDLDNVADVLQLSEEFNTTALRRIAEGFLISQLAQVDNLNEVLELAQLLNLAALVDAVHRAKLGQL